MLTIVDGECAMPVDPSTNSTCEFQTRNDCWPWITVVFCECSYLHLNTTTSQTTLSPHLQHLFNSKYKAFAFVVCNWGDKHAYACYACSLLFHSSNDLRSHQDSGFPQDFFIFHFHVSHSWQDSRYDHMHVLWSHLGFLLIIKAKSTPWQVVSVLQRLTLEIQYGLPTYPQVEQGWDFPEVVLWHVNLQIR